MKVASGRAPAWHVRPRIRLLFLVLTAMLLGPLPAIQAQQQAVPAGDPIVCPDGSDRGWTQFAGGPYPGRFRGIGGIVIDQGGNLIATDTNNARLQQLSPDGVLLGIVDLPSVRADERIVPASLAIDGTGTLYVADRATQRILKVTQDGHLLATWQADPVEGRTRFVDGRRIQLGGREGIMLGDIAVGGRYLYAHFFTSGSRFANPPPVLQLKRIDLVTGESRLLDTANLVSPPHYSPPPRLNGLAADSDGILYVAEYNPYGGVIRKVSPDGDLLDTWAGGTGEYPFARLGAVTIGLDGNLYVENTDGWQILAYTRNGEFLGAWKASNTGTLAVDRAGTIYAAGGVGASGGGQIVKVAPTGETIGHLGAPGDAPGLIEYVSGLELDANDTVIAMTVARSGQFVLQQFAPSGKLSGTRLVTAPATESYSSVRMPQLGTDDSLYALGPQYSDSSHIPGNTVVKFRDDGEVVKRWQPDRPGPGYVRPAVAYAVSPDETVYIADEESVYKIGPDGRQQARWRAEDVDRWAPRGRTFTATALALDAVGNLYVGGDWFVYKLAPDGTVLARWGDVPTDEYRTGPSMFSRINGLVIDPSGNVYVSHGGLSPIKMLAPDGTLLAAWNDKGSQGQTLASDPGGGTLRIDGRGDIYLANGREIWRLACASGP